MKHIILITVLLMCLREYNVIALNLPGPRVYVVTPSPRHLQIDEGRSRPFYYHNWMRRVDDTSVQNTTTSPTTRATQNVKTPDLIFAEFESDSTENMKKSIRKLLEKEKVVPQTTTKTTFRPIYVPDEELQEDTNVMNYGIPINAKKGGDLEDITSNGPIEYYDTYNKVRNNVSSQTHTPSTTQSILLQTVNTKTAASGIDNVENIWQIIDSEKNTQNSGNWEEVPIESSKESAVAASKLPIDNHKFGSNYAEDGIDENFALPGFGSNPGNGGENESRAIRNEQNIRFPYVNLKTFQLKNLKNPSNNVMNHKKENNLMTSLDNFHDLKNPVRGESQDVVPMRNIIDRYNPAQPYLPPSEYGNKISKQNSVPTPSKATAMLVPPPPPPKLPDNNFPILTNPYESFPPYAAPSFDSAPPAPTRPIPKPPKPSVPIYSSPAAKAPDDTNVDSDNLADSNPLMDIQFRYKPPAPPVPQFAPTLPPVSKPFTGYSYEKPSIQVEQPIMTSMDDSSDFHGYHYSQPDSIPQKDEQKPPAPTYGHHDGPPTYDHDSDYPELIFQKHHGSAEESKGTDDMTAMAPPPMDIKPGDHGPPMDDHGFPSDFPGDFKYHHDFDDHDFYHHHHHHPTTTTTTTEMPRVNRYSYYYLGKKLYYLPLYFSIYFIVYVGALIIKAVLRHKIVYPNSWRPNTTTASFFSKRSVDAFLSNDNLHEVTGRVTHALATAAEKYLSHKSKD